MEKQIKIKFQDDGIEEAIIKNLANAIIVEACNDYVTARKRLDKDVFKGTLQPNTATILLDVIDFFGSDFFSLLSRGQVPKDKLLKKLEEDINNKTLPCRAPYRIPEGMVRGLE